MKSATIPTIVAGFALAGVVLLFFQQLDADVRHLPFHAGHVHDGVAHVARPD